MNYKIYSHGATLGAGYAKNRKELRKLILNHPKLQVITHIIYRNHYYNPAEIYRF